MNVLPINRDDTIPWIVSKHYAHRMPSSTIYCFGLYDNREILGVVAFGYAATPAIQEGVCGPDWAKSVIELNRLVIEPGINRASFLIGGAIRFLPRPTIIVSYSDTAVGHIGYVYQACNFHYTGSPTAHDCEYLIEGKKVHARLLTHRGITDPIRWAKENRVETVKPMPKHRYVYFHGTRKQRYKMMSSLRYNIMSYPKGETKRYDADVDIPKQMGLFNGLDNAREVSIETRHGSTVEGGGQFPDRAPKIAAIQRGGEVVK